jgi:hypothetical protein
MENSRELVVGTDESPGFLQQCLLSKVASATDEFVQSTCNNYSRLLGLLDAIWSTVRGISGGLLPTNEQKMNLRPSVFGTGQSTVASNGPVHSTTEVAHHFRWPPVTPIQQIRRSCR